MVMHRIQKRFLGRNSVGSEVADEGVWAYMSRAQSARFGLGRRCAEKAVWWP